MTMKDTIIARKLAENFVKDFNKKNVLPLSATIDVPDGAISKLALGVVNNNLLGVLKAFGAYITVKGERVHVLSLKEHFCLDQFPLNIVEIADATSDIVVVTKGTQATYGFQEQWGMLDDMAMIQKYMDVVCQQTIRTSPTTEVSAKDRKLRASLIVEESIELLTQGFGYLLMFVSDETGEIVPVEEDNVKDVSVELEDDNFVVDLASLGKLLQNINLKAKLIDAVFGIPSDEIMLEEVMRSNLDKIWDDGTAHFREDGKNIKPPNHQPPNIARVLKKQAEEAEKRKAIEDRIKQEEKARAALARKEAKEKAQEQQHDHEDD